MKIRYPQIKLLTIINDNSFSQFLEDYFNLPVDTCKDISIQNDYHIKFLKDCKSYIK